MKLTRNLYIPMLDVSDDGSGTYKPIDLSTVFEFAWNPNTETYGYIKDKNDTNEVTGYAPTMEQEIVLDNTNPIYSFLFPKFMDMPVGAACVIPCLLATPDLKTGAPTVGYLWAEATCVPDTLATVDGKLQFTLNFNGDAVKGTVAINGGTVTFTPATAGGSTEGDAVGTATVGTAKVSA